MKAFDLPEVSGRNFDADKEGFLRSESALIQTLAARITTDGRVIMYADNTTGYAAAISDESSAWYSGGHNTEHGITPTGIKRRWAAYARKVSAESKKPKQQN